MTGLKTLTTIIGTNGIASKALLANVWRRASMLPNLLQPVALIEIHFCVACAPLVAAHPVNGLIVYAKKKPGVFLLTDMGL